MAFYGITYYIASYYHNTLQVLGASNSSTTVYRFEFNLTQTQLGFFGLDFYDLRMYHSSCKKPAISANMQTYLNGNTKSILFNNSFTQNSDQKAYSYNKQTYQPGRYSVFVGVVFSSIDVPDFAFRAYLNESVKIGFKTYKNISAGLSDINTVLQPSSQSVSFITYNSTQKQ